MIHVAACAIASAVMRFNRAPIVVLAFPFAAAAVLAAGWEAGQLQLTLLALTTVLSIDASWSARLVMLKQGQDSGEIDAVGRA